VQTSLETSIESLKKFGLVVLCLGLLLALAWPPGGLVLAVLGFLFYLVLRFVNNNAACYYLVDVEKKKIIYHVELPFFQRDYDDLSFSQFNCVGVRTDWRTASKLQAGKSAWFGNESDYDIIYKWKYQLVGITSKGKTIELGLWKEGGYSQLNILAKQLAEIMEVKCKPAKKDFINRKKNTNKGYMLVSRRFSWWKDSMEGRSILLFAGVFAISIVLTILDALAGVLGLK
jgi:hypothetical protein